jgi:UDP-N-acetylglucosamine diphosphorylase/glucosamine-1-phosphate N-acetyltransferase
MPALCLFEDPEVAHLAPLALTRAASDLRVGARTLGEAAVAAFRPDTLALLTRPAVAGVAANEHPEARVGAPDEGGVLFVNARWLVREGPLVEEVRRAMRHAEPRAFTQDGTVVALWHPRPSAADARALRLAQPLDDATPTESVSGADMISALWHLIDDLDARIAHDIESLGGLGRHDGAEVQEGARLVCPERIHLAPGVEVRPGAVLNATPGPIHLAAGVVVGENAVLRGPIFLGAGCLVKPGARVDASSAGPGCKLGGEVHASVLHSHTSKSHDGYLGNSYLGRWCNLGADSNTSNLKNDYGEVSVYDAVAQDFLPSGRQFAGLFMGDHSKAAINTAFNTGTVVGVFCNIFGAGFPPRHLPSFSWGGAEGLSSYRIDKALRVAEAVLARRGRTLSAAERTLLTALAAEAHG